MTPLEYYGQVEIQKEILSSSLNREVAIRFNNNFGKRPDLLQFESDIYEAAKKGATSFHISEERWNNPLLLKTGMQQNQLDDLRIGFDLIIDIDFDAWNCTKIISMSIIKALKYHGIKKLDLKFSGNKGFHIAIPFEVFPENFRNKPTKDLFPEGTRKILKYLIDYIDKDFYLSNKILSNKEFQQLEKKDSLVKVICTNCFNEKKTQQRSQFICTNCGDVSEDDSKLKFKQCTKCHKIVKPEKKITKCECSNNKFTERVNFQIDTQLITNRHLFRSPYSINEKTGLVSLPIPIDSIPDFNKDQAKLENIKVPHLKYLNIDKTGDKEAIHLIDEAFRLAEKEYKPEIKTKRIYTKIKNPINKDLFPPCIKLALDKGLEDGKKRFVFVLYNFLSNLGYSKKEIELLVREWNSKNKVTLLDNYLTAQFNWHNKNPQNILPPNCPSYSTNHYYDDIKICNPDNFCKTIKNPAQYTLKKYRFSQPKPKKKPNK